MLWYGSTPKYWTFKKAYKKRLLKTKLHGTKLALKILRPQTLSLSQTLIYVPVDWHLLSLVSKIEADKKALYLYNKVYYFKILLPKTPYSWFFDYNTRIFNSKSRFQTDTFPFYSTLLHQLLRSFFTPFFNKLKIKGKGYYVYKNGRNTITHQFGHSHRTYIYAFFLNVKFLSKTTILLLGVSKNDLILTSSTIRASKYINIFTGRGVRFAKQVIYKKTGKVSSYR